MYSIFAAVVALVSLGAAVTGAHDQLHLGQAASDAASTQELLLVDGHNDFPIWIRAFYQNHIYRDNFTSDGALYGQVDFPRLREGGVGAQFWSVYVECPAQGNGSFEDDAVYYENIHDTLQQIDLVYRLVERFPSHLQHAFSAADVRRQHREYLDDKRRKTSAANDGDLAAPGRRISSLLGIEGLHQIGNSASVLRTLHALGVRYATLTHTCHNAFADSEEPAEPAHGGLSAAGVALVREMNRLGVMVDLSHTSAATQRQALGVSRAPVIFSHSNAFALCAHSRNVPDDVLDALARNRGVVMVTFYPAFVTCEPGVNASLSDVADHVVYIGRRIGYDHVGIGSDFDGMAAAPAGLEHVGKYPDLARELLRRGLTREQLAGVFGLNAVRVLDEVERVARRLKLLELPLEDDVKPFFS